MAQLMEYVKMAFMNIWGNKARTLLTMLGIIIGISSVILIVSIGNGATGMIADQLGSIGKGQIYFYSMEDDEKYYITQEELDAIRKMDGVKAVANQYYFNGTTSTRKDDFSVSLVGLDTDGFQMLDNTYIKGGPYDEKEASEGKPYCIINENDAIKLFGSVNVVGMDIDLNCFDQEMAVTIKGVTKSEDSNMITSAFQDPSVEVIIPPEAISKNLGMDLSSGITDFYLLKKDDADAKKVMKEVVNYLEIKHHCKGEDIYGYESFDDSMQTVNSVMNMITIFVAFVASVSLLVGGIGVMNIMLVSVTERTREIGIRKALGAKTGSITIQFLAESAFITMIGGIIGIIVGVSGAFLIAKGISALVPTMQFSPSLKFSTIFLATAFSSCVGIFFGIYPARKAAKMNPIEALRYN